MKKYIQTWTLMMAITMFFTGSSYAAEDAALLKDMTSVVALLGVPCGQVVSAVKKADNDHVVTCQDGNHYRIFLNPEGRVVAQKQ
ncbi:MAG: hypothetical protein HY081_04790 [Gammaproteobacteria bacterium]|nr:hypothetical protein [Gammaproteobacteria bacterium]